MRESQSRLGIGIITYNRRNDVLDCIEAVRRYTRRPFHLVVADDGSSDDTVEQARAAATVVTGANRGVAWNKNRALFYLRSRLRCDVCILLEDDCVPLESGWEEIWVEATSRWGHVNIAADWSESMWREGSGTADDPYFSEGFTAQCSAFSSDAIDHVGYYDTRFAGYGVEHVDHSQRLARAGFGGRMDAKWGIMLAQIRSPLTVKPSETNWSDEQVNANVLVYNKSFNETYYRHAWRTNAEYAIFRAELGDAR